MTDGTSLMLYGDPLTLTLLYSWQMSSLVLRAPCHLSDLCKLPSRGSVMSIHCDTGYMFQQLQTASITVWAYETTCGDDLEWKGLDVIPSCIGMYLKNKKKYIEGLLSLLTVMYFHQKQFSVTYSNGQCTDIQTIKSC